MPILTEVDACPLTGDVPDAGRRELYRPPPGRRILIPCGRLPATATDAQAEHERALGGFETWSRAKDGSVILWGDM